MPGTLTKTDVRFEDFRIFRTTETDPNTQDIIIKWYVTVGYTVVTAEGEEFNRNLHLELAGARKTAAKNFLTDLYGYIKTQEGI